MNKRYRLGEIEEAVSEMEELIDIEDDIAEIDDYKMSRPNVQKILYKNVQLVCLS